jgi:hypothetical protein
VAAAILSAGGSTLHGAEPVRVIFDTDMDSDCDDVGALAMLHALADRGEAEILATTVSSKHAWSARCTDAINTYFGRPSLPIGVPKRAGPFEQGSTYARQIAEGFPHDLPEDARVPDAAEVYRQVLSSQPDGAVVVVTVGDLTNLRYLLESQADAHSPLGGRELVALKVKHWVCMGSRYPADRDPKKWGNFKLDAESTVRAIAQWPTPITFTGGGHFAESLATGARLVDLPRDNPVRQAYGLYFKGEPRNRHSADQIAVWVAVRGSGSPWQLVTGGYNHIFDNGTHEWRKEPDNPRQQYISSLRHDASPREIATDIEDLMLHRPPRQ